MKKYLPVAFIIGFFIFLILVIQIFTQAVSGSAPGSDRGIVTNNETVEKQDVSVDFIK